MPTAYQSNLLLRDQASFNNWIKHNVYAAIKKKIQMIGLENTRMGRSQRLSESSTKIFQRIYDNLTNLIGKYHVRNIFRSKDGQFFSKELNYRQHFIESLKQQDLQIRNIPETRETEDQFKHFIREYILTKLDELISSTNDTSKGIEIAGSMLSDVKYLVPIGQGGFGRLYRYNKINNETDTETGLAIKVSDVPIVDSSYAYFRNKSIKTTLQRYWREIRMNIQLKEEYTAIQKNSVSSDDETKAKLLWLFWRTQISSQEYSVNLLKAEKKLYIIQKLYHMNGRDLEVYQIEAEKRKTPLTLKQISFIIHDLLLGLNFLHLRNVIHRDISTNNILVEKLDEDGGIRVVLCDYDNSRHLGKVVANEAFQMKNLTGASLMGKVNFRPPEGIYLTSSYDQRWDVFQMGIVFMSLFCGASRKGKSTTHPYVFTEEAVNFYQKKKYTKCAFHLFYQVFGAPCIEERDSILNFHPANIVNSVSSNSPSISDELQATISGF